jgi:hypothetical protein
LLAGGFILGLPILNSIQILGWIWFCVWLAALPSLLACVIALGVLASREKATLSCVAFGVVAVLANIQPALDFWSAAASGLVDATPVMKRTNTSWVATADKLPRSLRSVSPAPP